ncbi:MAG TPA: Ig-like domain-containing protein [Polyangia bacterium]|nr:Ig-like domain-containing protein [Polyangia bacterium]
MIRRLLLCLLVTVAACGSSKTPPVSDAGSVDMTAAADASASDAGMARDSSAAVDAAPADAASADDGGASDGGDDDGGIVGVGACAGQPDGTGCDDQDACTGNDRCDHGVCGGSAVTCAPAASCYQANGCDPKAGCLYQPTAGASCSGGVQCDSFGQCVGQIGPIVSSTTPADGSDVAPGDTIVIDFTAPIDPNTIAAGDTVQLLTGSPLTQVPLDDAELDNSGQELTLTVSAPGMLAGNTYYLYLAGYMAAQGGASYVAGLDGSPLAEDYDSQAGITVTP